MMSTDNEHVPTLLKTAALADPDAWRDRVRDPGIWSDDAALKELADNADMSRQSPHLAQLLAVRLKDKKLNPVPFLRDALTHHPNDFWLHLEAAEATTNWPDRIGHYYAALSVRSDSSPIHNNLAHVLQRVGDMPGTVRHFTRAIESDPDHIVAHIGLADALARMRDSDGAQRERLIASQLAMTNACDRDSLGQATAIHLALIRSFGRSDDVPMMRLHIDKALELVDGSPDNVIDKDTAFGLRMAQRDLGTILYRLKDYEGALPYLEAVKNDRGLADPDRLARLYGDIADMWRSRNDLPKAKAWYQKYVLYQHSRSYFPVPPGPIAHPLTGNRFETACATVVVAPHSSMNRQLTRYQALVWLRTDLDRWLQAVQTVEGRRLIQIRDALRTWQTTVDLASVRDPDKMSKLPAAERLAWELLWADIEQILAQPENKLLDGVADATKPPTRRTAAPQAQDLFLLACAALRSGQTKSGERASSSRADALQYLRAALDAWVTRIGDYSPGSVIEASESLELWQITPELAMAHRKSSATQQRK
jgi:tetratricopeptide (TPR) repeat protein